MKTVVIVRALVPEDNDAWNKAGEELRLLDPQRYIAILRVVEEICSIHKDPLADGTTVIRVTKTRDFD